MTRLYVAHRRGIKAYLNNKVGDAAIADDLTQEAFLRLAEGGATAVVNGRAWLYRTAHNLAVDHHRREARRRTDTVDTEQLAAVVDDTPAVEELAAARSALDRVRSVLEELPERTQQVFVATRIDGMTYSEAAEHLGISDSSVQKHLARAVHHVMQRMKPR
ncbi:RNA polymerase sigma factor [Croceicoccus estronivorus]|uniref:RNA polymerase sigma factor n=1 Tax=Croceicoccus estronivorus TaxID=1172626 RepID=UPI0019D39CEF|nr:RNA polymerase sigma factor [Croceicoccus estronivorus]